MKQYDGKKLSKEVRTKRIIELKQGVRAAAKEIGTSPATLSRLENERLPDVNTLYAISKWLGKPMEHFYTSKTK